MLQSGVISRISAETDSDEIIDSDDSWDEETKEEVAADIEEQREREERLQACPVLDKEQVSRILQETIDTISEAWHKFKRPKFERNEYKIWVQLRKLGGNSAAQWAHKRAQDLQHSIDKLRKGIEDQLWKSEAEVCLQAKSLEQTVENRCKAL